VVGVVLDGEVGGGSWVIILAAVCLLAYFGHPYVALVLAVWAILNGEDC